jgi:hypothetical protein
MFNPQRPQYKPFVVRLGEHLTASGEVCRCMRTLPERNAAQTAQQNPSEKPTQSTSRRVPTWEDFEVRENERRGIPVFHGTIQERTAQ